MSDNVMDDLVNALDESGTPNPTDSQTDTPSSPDQSDGDLDALIDRLVSNKRLIEAFKSAGQSDKDKGIVEAKKDAKAAQEAVNDVRATVARLKEYVEKYGSEDRAIEEMERDDKIDALLSGNQPAAQSTEVPGRDDRPWGVRQKEILESAGISSTDPRVRDFAIEQRDAGVDPESYIQALKSKSFEWAQTDLDKPKPDISTVTNPSSGVSRSVNVSGTAEELGDHLIELQRDYSKNKDRIAEITKELERLEKEG